MGLLKEYKASDIKRFIAGKKATIPAIVTPIQEAQAVKYAMERLSQFVFMPRFIAPTQDQFILTSDLSGTSSSSYLLLPEDCDAVSRVIFPQESQWPTFFGGVDMTMYLFNRYQFVNFDSVAEFGALAGTLNVINRRILGSFDWEQVEDRLYFHGSYSSLLIHYLPQFSFDIDDYLSDSPQQSWLLYNIESMYFEQASWTEWRITDLEARQAAEALLGNENSILPTITEWKTRRKDVLAEFRESETTLFGA